MITKGSGEWQWFHWVAINVQRAKQRSQGSVKNFFQTHHCTLAKAPSCQSSIQLMVTTNCISLNNSQNQCLVFKFHEFQKTPRQECTNFSLPFFTKCHSPRDSFLWLVLSYTFKKIDCRTNLKWRTCSALDQEKLVQSNVLFGNYYLFFLIQYLSLIHISEPTRPY